MANSSLVIWLAPTLLALLSWGVGQGLVKKYISEVPPARFCLYFVIAKAFINIGFFALNPAPSPFTHGTHGDGASFAGLGILAYILDGLGWIFYFLSIVHGPIAIVGTLSAAFPAITVILARIFLSEVLNPMQYVGVVAVIVGCIGLSYDKQAANGRVIKRRWILFAMTALVIWGCAQTLVKYVYSFEAASESYMALFNTAGGFLTLGVYGFVYGRQGSHRRSEWLKSFVPMGLMALGDLFVIIALSKGPTSIVSPLSGAYPLVTILFARYFLRENISRFHWLCIGLILLGMFISPGNS